MKNLLLCVIALVSSFGIYAQDSNFMTFRAEITNPTDKNITICTIDKDRKIIKTIKVDKNGVFTGTLNVTPDRYFFIHGNELTPIFLKNGFDLTLKVDTQMFDETLVYTGKGAAENSYLAQNLLFHEKTDLKTAFLLDEAAFIKLIEKNKSEELELLEKGKLDPIFVKLQTKKAQSRFDVLVNSYSKNHDLMVAKSKLNNSISPSFEYENYKGGKTKLEDFKGSYVYIDIWATWCGPCRAEIPFLQKIEEEFHDKNIAFVSISIDVAKDFEKWKTFVTDKNLGGVQLFADNNWNSEFMKFFGVTGIPRFILIDPNGKIIKGDAARPSDPELRNELSALLN